MRVTRLRLREFRSYAAAEVTLGSGLTVIHGRNGAGKTNLVEALYLGCTGHSCRTSTDREAVRFGERVARVEVDLEAPDAEHRLAVGLDVGEGKRMWADGREVERLSALTTRPLVGVFLPDRLELVKGPPATRRGHLDQVVAALRPARVETRRAYGRVLAQRNALLGRIRAGHASRDSLTAWDRELARHGIELMADRSAAVAALSQPFVEHAAELGLEGEVAVAYRPRSRAPDAETLAAELAERTDGDVDRGFTGHGPHRDDFGLLRDKRDLRTYGSQGQQRLALLALLLAERAALADARGVVPLMLLDDVLSELDAGRRERLIELLRSGGQSVLTSADIDLVPGAGDADVHRLAVADGAVVGEAPEVARAA